MIATDMYLLIAFLSLLNFGRILMMIVGTDLYDIKLLLKKRARSRQRRYAPLVSVVIPAYNEEAGVIRTVSSVLRSTYANKQVIVVNDGSRDRTRAMLRAFQRRHPGAFTIVNQANAGKAAAINRAVRYWAKGRLVMVLDADSLVHPTAIANMAQHFRDRRVIAAASNVKIIPTRKVMGVVQRFEYLISYRMKRALTVFNMEYIIGGVGSTFRRSALLGAGLYDTDTMTEDIDLTVKLIRRYGNKRGRIHYAADALTFTEHVLSFRSLIRQRFRWKFGRFQTLLKNRAMLFNTSSKYDKRLTWYQLPYALFGELILLLEPLLVGYILFVVLRYADLTSLISVYLIVTAFVFIIVMGEESEPLLAKVSLALALPFLYGLMYILSAVEFIALLQSLRRLRQLFERKATSSRWEHVERAGGSVAW